MRSSEGSFNRGNRSGAGMGPSPGWEPDRHLRRETDAPLATAAAQHGATVAGSLPHEEAMRPLTSDLGGLIGSFHDVSFRG